MSPSQKRKAVSEKKQVGMGAKASPIRKGKASSVKTKTSDKKKIKTSDKKKMKTSDKKKIKTSDKKKIKTSDKKKMKSPTTMNTPLCPRGKRTAKAKFKVYPSAYANGYAVQVCKGKKPDLSGKKKCDPPYC